MFLLVLSWQVWAEEASSTEPIIGEPEETEENSTSTEESSTTTDSELEEEKEEDDNASSFDSGFAPMMLMMAPPAGPNATLTIDIINSAIAPLNASSTFGTTTIDLRFSSAVAVDLNIIDDSDTEVKHLYSSGSVTNPQPKYWTGKDNSNDPVADGTYAVQVIYSDVGGQATNTSETILVDNTSPVTGASALASGSAYAFDTWADEDVIVTLSSADDGAGIKKTYYSTTTPDNFVEYLTPFTITAEGTTTIKYYSTDNVDNQETENQAIIKIDRTEPEPEPEPEAEPPLSGSIASLSVISPEQVSKEKLFEKQELIKQRKIASLQRQLRQVRRQLLELKYPGLFAELDVPNPEVAEPTSTATSTDQKTKKSLWDLLDLFKFW